MSTEDSPTPPTTDPSETVLTTPARKERLIHHAPVVIGVMILCAGMLYGGRQLLREWGVEPGLSRGGQEAPLRLDRMASVPPPTTATVGTAPAPRTVDPNAVTLRDQPPRMPPRDLPQFTLRDGEVDDVLTDLDAEMMKRLGAVQGQLDGLTARVESLSQTVQALTRLASQQYQQVTAQQRQAQQELAAARQDIAALTLAVADVEARLKRGASPLEEFATTGKVVPGWTVTAISGERAWLRTPKGTAITVTAGERLQALGTIQAVDPLHQRVVLRDGRVVR